MGAKNKKVILDFCLKYPEMIDSFYIRKRWVVEGGDEYRKIKIPQEDMNEKVIIDKLKEGYKPMIDLANVLLHAEYYEMDKIKYSKYPNLMEDLNKIKF